MTSPCDPAEEFDGADDPKGQARGASETGPGTPSPGPAASPSGEESWVVLAVVPSSRVAERTVAHLGSAFRREARQGRAGALIVTSDRHGSFRLVQSRFVTASGLAAAVMGASVSIMVGLHGLISSLKGARTGAEAVRARGSRVGAGAERVREVLGGAGEHGAGLVIRCAQDQAAQVQDDAAQRAIDHWRGSRSEFLTALDRLGSEYDWLRRAADEPAGRRVRE